MKLSTITAATFSLLLSAASLADWQLNTEQSQLSFISTKAGHNAEIHRFSRLDGSVSPSGEVAIAIDLSSVETGIDIRNQRMKSMLFESEQFPQAQLSASVDANTISGLKKGDTIIQPLRVTVDLHGQQVPVDAEVLVAKLSDQQLLVTSWKPLVVNVGAFSLVQGVETLREVAGLPSISYAVPVSFVLSFEQP